MEHKGRKFAVLLSFSFFLFILWIFVYPVIQDEMKIFQTPQPENQPENQNEQSRQIEA